MTMTMTMIITIIKTKKIPAVFIAFLFVLCAAALPVSAESLGEGESRVFDYASLFTPDEVSGLESLIASLRSKWDMDFVVLTSYDAETDRSQDYADDFYDNNGFGAGGDYSGFVFFIDMSNRVPTISTCGLMIRYVTDYRLSSLLETAYNHLTDGEYGGAAQAVLAELDTYLTQGIPEDQNNIDQNGNADYYNGGEYGYNIRKAITAPEFFISLVIALASGLIMFAAIKSKYGLKGSTYKYDVGANTAVKITSATDVYIRSDVVRTPKQTNSGGSGSSSSSHTHTSSSGRSHGGGSGRHF